ncbi:MAG: FtsX-like permease family protein, partial [Chloroflexota bacterium]|nr:FtsX-like permease family protein [Chloroflexota bacterium]
LETALGLRRATREPRRAAVLVLVLGAATLGGFGLSMLAHLDRATTAVGWHEVGAAFRVTSRAGVLPDRFDPSTLPGVEASARVFHTTVATRGVPGFELLAVDLPAYRAVVSGTPLDTPVPQELLEASGPPYPAIVSTDVASDVNGVRLGDVFGVGVLGRTIEVRAVAVRDSFPTLEPRGRFAVVSLAQLSADAERPIATSAVFLRAPDDATAKLRRALDTLRRGLVLDSRVEHTSAFRTSPVIAAVSDGLAVSLALDVVFAALALLAALTIAGSARAVEGAHLRALGMRPRQRIGLAIAEHGATLAVGLGLGLGLGLWLFSVLEPGLGYAALIGSELTVPPDLDAAYVAVAVGTAALIGVLALALAVMLEGSIPSAAALRPGIE